MVRLVSHNGVVVSAEPSAVRRMLDSGMFSVCKGESLPDPEPSAEPSREPEPPADPDPVMDLSAFGGDDEEAEQDDLEKMTNPELAVLAKELGATVPKRANKQQLVSIIREARG